jgi:hypothetical protein
MQRRSIEFRYYQVYFHALSIWSSTFSCSLHPSPTKNFETAIAQSVYYLNHWLQCRGIFGFPGVIRDSLISKLSSVLLGPTQILMNQLPVLVRSGKAAWEERWLLAYI